jgi:hypothetical protein
MISCFASLHFFCYENLGLIEFIFFNTEDPSWCADTKAYCHLLSTQSQPTLRSLKHMQATDFGSKSHHEAMQKPSI